MAYDGTGCSEEDIWQELVCDAMGGMNEHLYQGHRAEAERIAGRMQQTKDAAAMLLNKNAGETAAVPAKSSGKYSFANGQDEVEKFFGGYNGKIRSSKLFDMACEDILGRKLTGREKDYIAGKIVRREAFIDSNTMVGYTRSEDYWFFFGIYGKTVELLAINYNEDTEYAREKLKELYQERRGQNDGSTRGSSVSDWSTRRNSFYHFDDDGNLQSYGKIDKMAGRESWSGRKNSDRESENDGENWGIESVKQAYLYDITHKGWKNNPFK